MKRPRATAPLVLLALAGASLPIRPALAAPAAAEQAAPTAKLAVLDKAIDRGLAWVGAQSGLEVGDLYALQHIDRPAARELVRRELAERTGSLGAFEGLVNPGTLAAKSPDWKALEGQRYEPLALWLYHAANAPGIPVPESVLSDLLSSQRAEYLLAHQVLALRVLSERGVISGPGLEAWMATLLRDMEAEQRAEAGFSDLFAEREALLLSGGRVAPETSSWIARILSAQEDDGRWRVPRHPYPTTLNELHVTLVSLWALDEYARLMRGVDTRAAATSP